MLVLHDYECPAGHRQEDVAHERTRRVPKTIRCNAPGCRLRASKVFNGWNNASRFNRTAGRLYGRFDPQYGCVVESYEHKKALQRKFGMIDADDAVGGDRERLEEITVQGAPVDTSGVIEAESLKELGVTGGDEQKMKQDQLNVF
jgi:hypothetical protein